MAKWIVRAYAVILLLYTGWRTYDFISSNLPKDNINFWLSLAFLFSTEAGLIVWHELHLKHVTTRTQDNLAHVMTWVDFVGSLAAGIGDMILRQVFIEGYVMPPMLAQFLLYGLPAIMGANVLAIIVFENNDAEVLEDKAEKDASFTIHEAAMKQIRAAKNDLANEKADVIYRRIRGRVTGHVDSSYGNDEHTTPRDTKRQPVIFRKVSVTPKDTSYNGDSEANFTPPKPGVNGHSQ